NLSAQDRAYVYEITTSPAVTLPTPSALDGIGVGSFVALAAPDAAGLEVRLSEEHAVGALVELLHVVEPDAAADQHRELDRLLDGVEPLPGWGDRAARPGDDHGVDAAALGEILGVVLDPDVEERMGVLDMA